MRTIQIDDEGRRILGAASRSPRLSSLINFVSGGVGFTQTGRRVARDARRTLADRLRAETKQYRDRGLYRLAYRSLISDALPELAATFPELSGATVELVQALVYLDEKGAH